MKKNRVNCEGPTKDCMTYFNKKVMTARIFCWKSRKVAAGCGAQKVDFEGLGVALAEVFGKVGQMNFCLGELSAKVCLCVFGADGGSL